MLFRSCRDGAAGDRVFRVLVGGCALLVAAALLGIALSMAWGGREAFATFGWKFLVSTDWDAVNHHFGALVPIVGTVVTALIAMLLAVPVSFGIALFLTEVAPAWLRTPIASAIELLAGIPSIIYGMWGLFVFAPFMAAHVDPWVDAHLGGLPVIGMFFSGPPLGLGMLTAGIVLAIMVIPYIISVSREVLLSVPRDQREAALALGSTRWEATWKVVVPFAKTGIMGSIFLALARALGETMAVTMVIGNRPEVAKSLFAPGYTMASVIANEFSEATDDLYISALIEIGLALFLVTIIVNILAQLLVWTVTRGAPRRASA